MQGRSLLDITHTKGDANNTEGKGKGEGSCLESRLHDNAGANAACNY